MLLYAVSPLHLAALEGDVDVLKALLAAPFVDVNVKDVGCPFPASSSLAFPRALKAMRPSGVARTAQRDKGWSLLLHSVANADVGFVKTGAISERKLSPCFSLRKRVSAPLRCLYSPAMKAKGCDVSSTDFEGNNVRQRPKLGLPRCKALSLSLGLEGMCLGAPCTCVFLGTAHRSQSAQGLLGLPLEPPSEALHRVSGVVVVDLSSASAVLGKTQVAGALLGAGVPRDAQNEALGEKSLCLQVSGSAVKSFARAVAAFKEWVSAGGRLTQTLP